MGKVYILLWGGLFFYQLFVDDERDKDGCECGKPG